MKLTLIGVAMDSSVTNLTSLKHKNCLIDKLAWINCLEILNYFIEEFSISVLQIGVHTMLKIDAFVCAAYISNY
jgi:hypothetical protein